jgi:hypothetical protein
MLMTTNNTGMHRSDETKILIRVVHFKVRIEFEQKEKIQASENDQKMRHWLDSIFHSFSR